MEDNYSYKLPANNGGTTEEVLRQEWNKITTALSENFKGNYEVSHKDFEAATDDWTQEIKIRKGSKIGGAVDVKWNKKSPENLEIEVSASSKRGSMITYPIFFASLILGAYMGYHNIAPLDFLPGKKIAGGLGALLMLLPGGILIFLLQKALISKEDREQTQKLIAEINAVVRK